MELTAESDRLCFLNVNFGERLNVALIYLFTFTFAVYFTHINQRIRLKVNRHNMHVLKLICISHYK